jgi:Tfp pilus assembly protein PilF
MAMTMADQYYIKALDYYPYNLEEALENLNYALSYDGEHAQANCLMGRLYLEQMKDYERAEMYFQAALACDPEHADTCEHYSRLLVQQRAYAKAQKLLAYARKLQGARLAQLLQLESLIQEQQQQFAEAKTLLRSAILEAYDSELMEVLEADLRRVERKERMLQGFVYTTME